MPLLRFTQPLDADTQTFPYTIHTYYCDHRGAPTALISKEGKIEWQAEYDVWGNVLSESNPQKLYQPIRLQGQHYDLESGLYYNRHRYYDPQVGRYITQDPIGLEGGSNFYKYPFNPNQQIDPLGLLFWFLGAGALAGSGTATVGTLTVTEVAVVGVAAVGTGALILKTAEELSKAHEIASSTQNKSAEGYGGNCTPEEHDELKRKQDEACNKAKGLSCKEKNEIDTAKGYLLDDCAEARINIAKRCFAGGDKGHNQQIDQMKSAAAKCLGYK